MTFHIFHNFLEIVFKEKKKFNAQQESKEMSRV